MSRKLAALFAERVLGWSGRVLVRRYGDNRKRYREAFMHRPKTPDKRMTHLGTYDCYYREDGTKVFCGEPHELHFPADYPNSLDAAWQGVEKIMGGSLFTCAFDMGMDQESTHLAKGYEWTAAFSFPRDCQSFHGKADTPALAVVKACLLAAGVSEKEIEDAE